MSISLDSTLKTALDGSDHKPVIKIVSSSMAYDVPFDGNYFNQEDDDESQATMVDTTTGRLVTIFKHENGNDDDLYLIYSDTDRTAWTEVPIYAGGYNVTETSLIELSNGNLGIVFTTLNSGIYRMWQMEVSQTGTVISAANQIASYTASSYVIDSPALSETATGFLLVYKHYDVSGDVYSLYKRTADSNFSNWSVESAIGLSGLTDTYDKDHPTLLQAASGRIYLFFDYVDAEQDEGTQRRNIYSVYSTDEGVTWSAPIALTNYDDYSASGVGPTVSEQSGGDIILAYHEVFNVLTITADDLGYCDTCGAGLCVGYIHYDDASNKLFVINNNWLSNSICNVLVIDVASWTIEECYSTLTSPGFNDIWTHDSPYASRGYAVRSYGQYVIFYNYYGCCVINHQTQTIKEYWWYGQTEHAIVKNINIEFGLAGNCIGGELDPATSRLYLGFEGHFNWNSRLRGGYIDLTETADPGTGFYTWHPLFYSDSTIPPRLGASTRNFRIWPESGLVSINGTGSTGGGAQAGIILWSLSTGSYYKSYTAQPERSDYNEGMWVYGADDMVLTGNKIYASIGYTDVDVNNAERRGLMIIDLLSDSITYERPTYSSLNNYDLQAMRLIDTNTRIIMVAGNSDPLGGVILYDLATHEWTRLNNDSVPGFTPDGEDHIISVDYDEVNGLIFTGTGGYSQSYKGVTTFPEEGNFKKGHYMTGTLGGDSNYTYDTPAHLNLYSPNYDLSIVHDENDVLWAVWTHEDTATGETSLQWDRDQFAPDVADYILAGSPAKVTWEIGKPAQLNFTLSRGDLFDPTNSMSIFSPLFKKGRAVEFFLGEEISFVKYFQKQGDFIVTGSRLDYERGSHPVINITCEDRSTFWDEIIVTATEGYRADTIANVLGDLLENVASVNSDHYNIPTPTNDHPIYIQWVDESLQDIIDDILNHFGAFGYWQTNGIWTFKEIDLTATVDHDYTDISDQKLFRYSPDDSYSSFINRVTVKCEGIDFLEVLWDEEQIETIDGTIGFWSKEETIDVYYSKDRTRRCRYPRLDILQSIADYSPLIKLLGGHGDEYISYLDPLETYCTIDIEAPDRAIYVFSFAAAVLSIGISAQGCDEYDACGYFIFAGNLALSALIQVISAVASYRYNLFAKPVGHELQMYQATADDTPHQNDLNGLVVTYEIEDPMSHTVQQCQVVADHEIAVAHAQRNRITFQKVAHLQDEIGDIIKISHPESKLLIDVFIPKLVRTYTKAPVGGTGQFEDNIDGWIII